MSAWEPEHHPAAERVRAQLAGTSWELFLERVRRFEVHLNGAQVEMRRGPVSVEGYGLRLFRPAGERVGIGIASSSDSGPASVDRAIRDAEATAPFSPSPAKGANLPARPAFHRPPVEVVDARVWDDPMARIESYVQELLAGVDGRGEVVPSFGSVRASLAEVAVVTSEGSVGPYPHTLVETEFALKAQGGPEGRPPGEYWINRVERGIPAGPIGEEVRSWCDRARDVRIAVPPSTGPQNILFPTPVLDGILPVIVGFRFSGMAAVQKMAAPLGQSVAGASVSVTDDGLFPLAVGSSPFDDEGTPRGRTPLIEAGVARGLVLDRVHAAALERPATGGGFRGGLAFPSWYRFDSSVGPVSSTLVVAPGKGGSEAELAEAAGDGIWVDQLGWASPDGVTSAFGGEIRLGYRIRSGKRAEPVRGGTVGGFALGPAETPPMLSSVSAIGSRPQLVGRLCSAPLLIEGFPVAGA